jgi:hypothetical protein
MGVNNEVYCEQCDKSVVCVWYKTLYKFDEDVKVVISHKYEVAIHIKGDQLLGNVRYGVKYDNRVYER